MPCPSGLPSQQPITLWLQTAWSQTTGACTLCWEGAADARITESDQHLVHAQPEAQQHKPALGHDAHLQGPALIRSTRLLLSERAMCKLASSSCREGPSSRDLSCKLLPLPVLSRTGRASERAAKPQAFKATEQIVVLVEHALESSICMQTQHSGSSPPGPCRC